MQQLKELQKQASTEFEPIPFAIMVQTPYHGATVPYWQN